MHYQTQGSWLLGGPCGRLLLPFSDLGLEAGLPIALKHVHKLLVGFGRSV